MTNKWTHHSLKTAQLEELKEIAERSTLSRVLSPESEGDIWALALCECLDMSSADLYEGLMKRLDLEEINKHIHRAFKNMDTAIWRVSPDNWQLFDSVSQFPADIQSFNIKTVSLQFNPPKNIDASLPLKEFESTLRILNASQNKKLYEKIKSFS